MPLPTFALTLWILLSAAALGVARDKDPEDNSDRFSLRQVDGLSPHFTESDVVVRDVVTLNDTCYREYWPLLSLDGGGLRAILTVEILVEIENAIKTVLVKRPDIRIPDTAYESPNEFEIDLADYFKAIAGVSSGSWIASYLASKGGNGASSRVFDDKMIIAKYGVIRPGSVEGLRVFFLHFASRLYPSYTIPVTIIPRWWRLPRVKYAGANCPLHPVRFLETTLDLFLGQSRFVDSHNTTLMVLTYDLLRRAAVFYVSDHFQKDPMVYTYIMVNEKEPRVGKETSTTQVVTGKHYFMKDIARASSAAPIIFEAKKFSAINDESFQFCAIDGTMMSNNPTLIASYFLLNNQRINQDHNIGVISIGTGISTGRYRQHSTSGAIQWFITTQDFLAILMDGGSEFVQTQFYALYHMDLEPGDPGYKNENDYLRIQTVYDRRTAEGEALAGMYDPSNVEALQRVGQLTVERFRTAIRTHVENIVLPEKCGPSLAEIPSLAEFLAASLEQHGEKSPTPPAANPEVPTT